MPLLSVLLRAEHFKELDLDDVLEDLPHEKRDKFRHDRRPRE